MLCSCSIVSRIVLFTMLLLVISVVHYLLRAVINAIVDNQHAMPDDKGLLIINQWKSSDVTVEHCSHQGPYCEIPVDIWVGNRKTGV